MGKYQPLTAYLAGSQFAEIPMTFAEVQHVIGAALPRSAMEHRPWWANEARGHVHAKAWLDAGYETAQVDMAGRKLVFRRIARNPLYGGGMSEAAREFKPAENASEKKQNRHPALGAMKGTFTIEPSWDLTKPTMSDEELAEMEANLHRTADMIDAGASGMSEAACGYQEPEPEKKRGRHPAFGALKGTFWIDPEWDLTKPTMSEEELDEMEANLHRTADLIDAGFSRKPR
jgi:hypothetical protein